MQQTPNASGQAEGLPLTHLAYMDTARRLGRTESDSPRLWVQVRKWTRDGPAVLCGQVAELHARDRESFAVDTDIGQVWATGPNVRLCSGDGRCTCDQAEPARC